MSEDYSSDVSGAEKNQNDQSSADNVVAGEDVVADQTPEVLEAEEGRNVFDIDSNFSLEDLIKRASKFGKKPELKPVEETVGTSAEDVEQIVLLKAQIEQEKNNTLRALADLQNLRRRSDEERLRIIRDGNERLIKEILPVLDDFERGLAAARTNNSYDLLISGVESVLRKFDDTLAKQGVAQIPAVGQPFNPDLHEAVSVQEGSDQPDETVLMELRRGYTLHDRVIRPTLVTVAKS